MADLITTLRARDLLADHTEGLAERALQGPLHGYIGFDPTSDSLHVGHLVSIRLLAHLAASGGRAVAVIGGATAMIGDPSGKAGERALLDGAAIDANRAAIGAQLGRLLGPGVELLDNRDWLGELNLLDFLRGTAKHFAIGEMLSHESVSARIAAGLSFTEFTYSLLQATDFLTLHRDHGVDLQMGGSDQWGNIVAGLELIRRKLGRSSDGSPLAFGLTAPLLLNPDGSKMGKTEDGAIFLDAARTSPFAFFQFWVNVPDSGVSMLLRRLTDLDDERIAEILAAQAADPAARVGQQALAESLTAWVHGPDAARLQARVAAAAFGRGSITDPSVLAELHANADGFDFTPDQLAAGAGAMAVASGLVASNNEARRLIAQNGLAIGGTRVSAADAAVELVAARWLVVRVGKRKLAVGRLLED